MFGDIRSRADLKKISSPSVVTKFDDMTWVKRPTKGDGFNEAEANVAAKMEDWMRLQFEQNGFSDKILTKV